MTIPERETGGLSVAGLIQEYRPLKAELWTKGYPKIVVRPVVEEDTIPGFSPKSNRPCEEFESASRIDRKRSQAAAQSDRVQESAASATVTEAEVGESDFARNKNTESTCAHLKFWPEKTMQRAE